MEKLWYNISANDMAIELTLKQLGIKKPPSERDDVFDEYSSLLKKNIDECRGIKYGVSSYSEMYMCEREKVLGNWESFFRSLCIQHGVQIAGDIIVAGINDGQEVGFLNEASIVGVDISREATERGLVLYPRIRFVNCNLLHFDFPEGSADSYFSFRSLHFFDRADVERILFSAKSFLKSMGKIVVSIPGGFLSKDDGIVFGQKTNDGAINKEKPMEDVRKIQLLIAEAGFVDIVILNHGIEIFIIATKP